MDKQKRLTIASKLLLCILWYKGGYFSRKNKLAEDGSFFYDDKRIAEEWDLNVKTIMRAKRQLVKYDYIIIQNGKHKGVATKYWIKNKPGRKSPFKPILKPDNLSVKPDNLSLKAPQNVTPNNIRTININNEVNKSLKDLGKGFVSNYVTQYQREGARRNLVSQGFAPEEVDKALEECNEENNATKNHKS